MATKEVVLHVFVAAPDDVTEEVSLIDDCIAELNRTLPRTTGIRLQMLNWRADAIPGIGVDPQAVINEQIDDPDIFIGVLWGRFGHPTLRAGSGSEEEFNRAYAQYQSSSASLRVMMYFKKAPIEYDRIDPVQFQAVKAFQSKISSQGVFYYQFAKREVFSSAIRVHLTRQVQEYGKTWGKTMGVPNCGEPRQGLTADEEEGLIDLIERGEAAFRTMSESVDRISSLIEQVGARAEDKTGQLHDLVSLSADQRLRASKQIFGLFSADVTQFSRGLSDESGLLSASLSSGVEALSKVLSYTEFYEGDNLSRLGDLPEVLHILPSAILGSRKMMTKLKQTMFGLPRVTTQFNRAKRDAVSAIEDYERFTCSALELISELQKRYDELVVAVSGSTCPPRN